MASKQRTTASRTSSRTKASTTLATTRITRAATTSSKLEPTAPVTTATKKSATQTKSLHNRTKSNDAPSQGSRANTPAERVATPKSATPLSFSLDMEREPIQAFLRLRPQLNDGEPSSPAYLVPISDTVVRMGDPQISHNRIASVNPAAMYTFSHVFPPDTMQSDFFNRTTLPLVKDVLEGQSGLLFAYGVTNSGKTYTIQGGSGEGSAGILPRTLDVIFNSVEGLHGDDQFRPVRLQGIEHASNLASGESPAFHISSSNSPALADVLDDLPDSALDTDPTVLKLDRNHEYTIWLSYAEVYNEKVYDLFAAVDSIAGTPHLGSSGIPRPTSTFLNMPVPSGPNPLMLTRKALPVKSCPPSDSGTLNNEGGSAGKYIAGLRQIRVKSAAEAKALLKLGQLHRRVFGTLANSQSSRSHALVTIKVLRVHRGERNDPTSIQTSRLTLVDLAGSERTKHTQTSGDRLREAGNINKSLMVLGQCLETLRNNQRTVARSLATSGERVDTREVKRALAIVPFRHSKLTEVLMDYFVGDGKAVMIVNVNPYDTGFDENTHVMKFASLAREVCTAPAVAAPRAVPQAKYPADLSRASDLGPHRRKVTISVGGSGRKASEATLEVLEEDEEPGQVDQDDEPINPLVDALFDEVEDLRLRLYDAQVECALIEANTREEVMEEMEERMRSMEKMYKQRLMNEIERSERRMDAKLDMLQQSVKRVGTRKYATAEEADEIETASDPEQAVEDAEEDEIETSLRADDEDETEEESDSIRSSSPLHRVTQPRAYLQSTARSPPKPPALHKHTVEPPESQLYFASQEDASDASASPISDEEYVPKHRKTPPAKRAVKQAHLQIAPSPVFEADVKAGRAKARKPPVRASGSADVRGLEREMKQLELNEDEDDAPVIIPDNKARQKNVAGGDPLTEYVPAPGETDGARKKKRQLGKHRTVADDELDAMSAEPQQQSRPLRRSMRH